jgi:hypothetical protein
VVGIKLLLAHGNIIDYAQVAFENDAEPGSLSFAEKPFAGLEAHIGGGLRQTRTRGVIEAGKDFSLSQLVCSEHGPTSRAWDASYDTTSARKEDEEAGEGGKRKGWWYLSQNRSRAVELVAEVGQGFAQGAVGSQFGQCIFPEFFKGHAGS